MKKKLPFLFGSLLMAVFAFNSANAQINYTENFEGTIGWTESGFAAKTEMPCEGEKSFAVNLYGGFVGNSSAETISPSIGTSDGTEVTLSYDYKVVTAENLGEGVNNSETWGTITISYGASASGPFTVLETVNSTNHLVSASCATRTVSFTPPIGAVYLKINVTLDVIMDDYFIYIDRIKVNAGDDCNIPAPTLEDDTIELCNGATASSLPSGDGLLWYENAVGGNPLGDEVVITEGTYYAAQVDGSCESVERTPATITLAEPVLADDPEDVYTCEEYILPALENGSYYTEIGGEGTELEAGDSITTTTLIYVYNDSETVVGCYTENSFTVNINDVEAIVGDNEQTIEEGSTVADINVQGMQGGTITWYADEDLTMVLADDFVLVDGETYYAVQTLGECESEVFELTVTVGLGTGDFSSSSFKFFPNPVNEVLNLSYTKNISGVAVFNLLGQQVLDTKINANDAQVDMSKLPAGTYMVKVSSEKASTMIKVVKL